MASLPLRRPVTSLLSRAAKYSNSSLPAPTSAFARNHSTRSPCLLRSSPRSVTSNSSLSLAHKPTRLGLSQPSFVRHNSDASAAHPTFREWMFDDITSASPNKNLILIDVREPAELKSTGVIPSAVCVPLASQPDALFLTPDEFETRFGFPKPGVKEIEAAKASGENGPDVVFYCKAGVRARAAAQLAAQAGYDAAKIGVYEGSWLDWDKRGGKVERWDGGDY